MPAVRSSFLALLLGTLLPPFAFAWSTDPAVNTPVAAVAGDQVHVVALANSDGSTIVAWEDARGGNRDIYAQKLDPSGVALWGSNGLVVCNAGGDQTEPHIASDGSGGCIVAWIDRRSGGADLYSQHLNSTGVATWTFNGLILCNASGDQREL